MNGDLDAVVDRIARAVPREARALVAVDGVGASGKTCFAQSLAGLVLDRPVVILHADDFFNPPHVRHARGRNSAEGFWLNAYDLHALTARALEPLRAGRDGLFRSTSRAESTEVEPTRAPPDALVLVEGTFLHRDELVEYWDFSVFLDVPFVEAARRMAARDGLAADDPRLQRYEGAQRLYFAAARPWERASLVVDTTRLDAPRIIDPATSAAAVAGVVVKP